MNVPVGSISYHAQLALSWDQDDVTPSLPKSAHTLPLVLLGRNQSLGQQQSHKGTGRQNHVIMSKTGQTTESGLQKWLPGVSSTLVFSTRNAKKVLFVLVVAQ